MRVEAGEIEFAGDEKEHSAHGSEARVAASLALGGLKQTVDGLDEAVGLAGLGPADDAVEVLADHSGDLLHRGDAGAHDIGAPLPEHGGNDIDLLAVEDVAQVLAVEPGASGALAGRLRDQAVEVGARFGGQAITVLEQCPAQSFEAGIGSAPTQGLGRLAGRTHRR